MQLLYRVIYSVSQIGQPLLNLLLNVTSHVFASLKFYLPRFFFFCGDWKEKRYYETNLNPNCRWISTQIAGEFLWPSDKKVFAFQVSYTFIFSRKNSAPISLYFHKVILYYLCIYYLSHIRCDQALPKKKNQSYEKTINKLNLITHNENKKKHATSSNRSQYFLKYRILSSMCRIVSNALEVAM